MKVTFTVESKQADEWVEEILTSTDVFRRDHAGYWMRGVELTQKRGWLVFDDEGGYDACDETAIEAWRAGKKLPGGYYRLDRAAAIKAWIEGAKRYGVEWFHKEDATAWDVALQTALLEKIVYG